MENLSSLEFERLLTKCASLPDVRREVIKNHDDNRWWPLYVSDWRLRMVIAGLSTRISYNMIGTYQSVVSNLNQVGYEVLSRLSDVELSEILTPLGLLSSRVKFCKSIVTFIKTLGPRFDISAITNDELINAIEQKVYGAGYKVGQCCVLYAKGYHCGVMPVDSGMRDKLSLCLGLKVEKTPFGNEIMRKQLEEFVSRIDCRAIARTTGYNELKFPTEDPLTWWAHLVLIYYKRLYCNRPIPKQCPLRSEHSLEVQSICSLHQVHAARGIYDALHT